MPTISMFYGIVVRMYFAPGEHNPPHFHVYYNECKASVDIRTCETIGSQPATQAREADACLGRATPGRADGELESGDERRSPFQSSATPIV